MKKSAQLLGLPIFSIEDGKETGYVNDLIINPAKGTVEYIIVNSGIKYLGIKVLPFKNIEGVGEHAITISNTSLILDIKDVKDINELLEKDVQVKGTKVITQKGKIIGKVREYLIDDENEGKIEGCVIAFAEDSTQSGIILSEYVITFGKDVLVVQQGIEENIVDSLPNKAIDIQIEDIEEELTEEAVDTTQESENIDSTHEEIPQESEASDQEPTQLFEDRQRQFLLGKSPNKTILSDDGEVLAEEGMELTGEMIEKATQAGKLLELIMNTRS